MSKNYRVNLEVFEGPMDLLLFLIRKNHLDVYDIPIAFLLDEYIKYLESLKELDIDMAAEFLLMTAELAHIKSLMLLPRDGDVEQEEEDPRANLVQRLIEYQRYKEVAAELGEKPQLGRHVFSPPMDVSEEERPIAAEVGALWKAFTKLIERLPPEKAHEIEVEHISVGKRVLELLEILQPGRSLNWEEILPSPLTRGGLIVTFLALLEMCKLNLIMIHQPEGNKIYIVADENLSSIDRQKVIGLDDEAAYGG